MSFTGKVGFTVRGLNETINALNNIQNNLPATKKQILQEAATVFIQHARANVHVVSGILQRSIRIDSVTDKQAIVSANTVYAKIEEERPGDRKISPFTPHAYMAPSAEATKQVFPGIIIKEINGLFSKNKTSSTFF